MHPAASKLLSVMLEAHSLIATDSRGGRDYMTQHGDMTIGYVWPLFGEDCFLWGKQNAINITIGNPGCTMQDKIQRKYESQFKKHAVEVEP